MNPVFHDIVQSYCDKTRKECFRIVKSDNDISCITDSRVGGQPYIPIGHNVPMDNNGKYMTFLMLINLKDIDLCGYPNGGVLEVFLSLEWDIPHQFCILYFPDNLPASTDFPTLDCSSYEDYTYGSFAIKFEKTIDYMPTSDYRYENIIAELLRQYELSDIDVDKAKDFVMEAVDELTLHKPMSTICGYANFCQYDPRDSKDEKNACFIKIDALLDTNVINFGDCGIMSIMCSQENIDKKEFDKMICNIDCY